MFKTTVKTKSNNQAKQKLEQLKKNLQLKVGFGSAATYPDGTKVAHVAQYMEFGTNKVPARPFFRTAIKQNKNKWKTRLEKDLQMDLEPQKALSRLGVLIQTDIQNSIKTGNFAPLRPYTIRKKGFNKTLIDTGVMLRSVDWEVRKK